MLIMEDRTKDISDTKRSGALGEDLKRASEIMGVSQKEVVMICFALQFDQILHEVQQAPPRTH